MRLGCSIIFVALLGCTADECKQLISEGYLHIIGTTTGSVSATEASVSEARKKLVAALQTCDAPTIDFGMLGEASELDLAIASGNEELVRARLHAAPRTRDGTLTWLHKAALYGNPDIIRLIESSVGGLNVASATGETPLAVSVGGIQEKGQNTRALLDLGARPNLEVFGVTLLLSAMLDGELDAAKELVDAGACWRDSEKIASVVEKIVDPDAQLLLQTAKCQVGIE